MAFWGTEVKPGKPYTHSFDRVRGRLHVSQATLSIGSSEKQSLVQCNVGDKSPVLLCALLPDKTESVQLDLEFEEMDDVIFSVIGPRGVHLTGYYVGGCRISKFQDDTESYGEDINSDTEGSNRCADEEDEYEDSFINDDEPETLAPSPVSSDGVDEKVYRKKKRDGKGGRNRLKKRYQLIESDDETCSQQNIANDTISVAESDDEDKVPISSICKSKSTSINTIPELAEEKSNEVKSSSVETSNRSNGDDGGSPKTNADDSLIVDSKEKIDANIINDEPKMKEVPSITSLMTAPEKVPENQTKAKKKRKEHSKETKMIDDTLKGKPQLEEIAIKSGQDLTDEDMRDLELATDKLEEIAIKSGQDLTDEDMRDLEVATDKTSAVPSTSLPPPVEAGLEGVKKSKKKRKDNSKKRELHETDNGYHSDPLKVDKVQQAEAEFDTKEAEKIDNTLKVGEKQLEEIALKSGQKSMARVYFAEDNSIDSIVEDMQELEVATDKTSTVPCSSLPPPVEAGLENGKKSKKKRKVNSKKGDVHETDNGYHSNPLEVDKGQQAEAEFDTKETEINHVHESILPSEVVGTERISKGKKKRKERTEVEADFNGNDLPVRNEQDQKLTTDKSFDIVSDHLGEEHQSDDKKLKKKRRKKNKPEETEGNGVEEEEKNMTLTETKENMDACSSEARKLSNGLIIEDLEKGNSKGRKAAPGKKVKVQYTLKLKESGLVIDSNIGKSPYKFRIGDKEAPEGLNVGVEGMRVGDKRRLIIPPSMSSGSEGTGENVPPNSWLVYEVELLGFH